MTDLKLATQDGIFALIEPMNGMMIDGDPVQVLQHVPQETQPPIVVIAEITSEEVGAKGDPWERHIVEIVTEYRGPARKWLYSMMGEVMARVDGAAIQQPTGIVLSTPEFEDSEDGLLEDAQTYQGRQRFVLFAERTE